MESLSVVFHCTHVITHTLCVKTTAPASGHAVPASHPSDEAVPERRPLGARAASRPQSPIFGLRSGTPCLPKASFKGFTFHADKWIPDSTSATYFKRITQLVLLKNPNDSQTEAQQIQS